MIKENGLSFKDLEKKIYEWGCQICRECTKEFLERYDKHLKEQRDKARYRNKGLRRTTIKTIFGEVDYRRTVYEVQDGINEKRFAYLLDENLELDPVGRISTNMAELMVQGITELSYRECAAKISAMTGQSISAMGVWNVIQSLGEKVCREEEKLVRAHRAGKLHGEKEVPVLFEETDGVSVKLQGKDRKDQRQDKDNLDEVEQRILNADGASWTKKVKDKSTSFQLDPFHRNKAVREKLHDERARKAVLELLEEDKIEEMFQYLEIYKDSLGEDEEIADAEDLLRYYENNREGLLPYQSQGLELPEPPEGLEYRNMGTMENHVWSVIARRMKHNHTSWSVRGGNHLAKILAKKCSGKLEDVTRGLERPVFEKAKIEELYGEILMSAKAPLQDGKGYEYPKAGHVVGLAGKVRGEIRKLFAIAGY